MTTKKKTTAKKKATTKRKPGSVLDRVYKVLSKNKDEFHSVHEMEEVLGLTDDDRGFYPVSMALNTLFQRNQVRSTDDGEFTRFKGQVIMRTRCDCGRSWLYCVPNE